MIAFLFLLALVRGVTSEKTMVRQWHEVLLSVSHLASADPTVHARDFFHWSLVQWEVFRLYATPPRDSRSHVTSRSGPKPSGSVHVPSARRSMRHWCLGSNENRSVPASNH